MQIIPGLLHAGIRVCYDVANSEGITWTAVTHDCTLYHYQASLEMVRESDVKNGLVIVAWNV
jgi:hypothetical protein